jgi:hypothetical protein
MSSTNTVVNYAKYWYSRQRGNSRVLVSKIEATKTTIHEDINQHGITCHLPHEVKGTGRVESKDWRSLSILALT